MNVLETLKKEGFRFTKKNWPTVPVQTLRDLGITPTDLERDFRQATLAQTMGPLYCIGFFLLAKGGGTRALAIRNK
jgi:hypothetical protein